MRTTVWLRISALVSLLFTVGHFIGGLQKWSPTQDNAVLRAMRTVRFDVSGAQRTYLDLYLGLGHSLTVSLLLQTVLLWMFANVARTHAALLRPVIAAYVVAVALTGLIAWRYLFPIPALFALALCITLLLALVAAYRDSYRTASAAAA